MSSADCLPLIIGFGGINCAGRSSSHQAFRRVVFDTLSSTQRKQTLASLHGLAMSNPSLEKIASQEDLLQNSLIRKLSDNWFSTHNITPQQLESHAAGRLAAGFEPGALYTSRHHPRGLQMALFAINDCMGNMGFDWQQIMTLVNPDKIGVYASSSLGQLDQDGLGGLLQSRLKGEHPTTKQIPFSYPQSIADMINAYVVGNLGTTSCSLGACAGYLYNMSQAVRDIREGHIQVAIVGVSDAPLVPEVIEGFTRMGALASNNKVASMQGVHAGEEDTTSACRPFGNNCGFVLAESAQFMILTTPQLAMTLGARIFGAVSDVCVNADGYKQSISSPGIGNYLSVASCAARLRALLGEDSLTKRSLVHAHGTGTPVNRVTESDIYSRVAQAFGIEAWRVTGLKGLVGHSQAAASADQIALSLGIWAHDLIPGITTTPELSHDLVTQGLDFCLQHREIEQETIDAVMINAKGFGGNNATALLLSPAIGRRCLQHLFGDKGYKNWRKRSDIHAANAANYDANACNGEFNFRYLFNYQVLSGNEIKISSTEVNVPGYPDCILPTQHPLAGLVSKPTPGK